MYFVAIFLPPLAVLLVGKPFQALLNLILTLLGFFPGVIHAIMVVNEQKNAEQTDRIVSAIRGSKREEDNPFKDEHRDTLSSTNPFDFE